MNPGRRFVPLLAALCLGLLLAFHGPILQPAHYHHFADTRAAFGLVNFADVLSNIGFACVGLWGLVYSRTRFDNGSRKISPGYWLFLLALVLTAAGSFYYHLQPDDARLVWDRIPIALACAGLLSAVHAESTRSVHALRNTVILSLAAIASVVWWHQSGDLRPYLLMQALPLILIPLWQWLYCAPRTLRQGYGLAILLYVLAKVAELQDHEVLAITGLLSGHTLKHLLATAAAAMIVAVHVRREKAAR